MKPQKLLLNFLITKKIFQFLGDPRWIVEERPDATNVNNWHWKESNAAPWSKEQFKKLFVDFTIADDNNFVCKITEFEKIEGEATANVRLLIFYSIPSSRH